MKRLEVVAIFGKMANMVRINVLRGEGRCFGLRQDGQIQHFLVPKRMLQKAL